MNELEKTYARQVDMVFKICVLHLKNIHDSEEATQETFIKFIRYNPKFENLQHEKAWFIKTASNICKNILSSSWSSKVTCLDDLSYFQEQ
ncbi:RNA polymerase sigma factor, partial [Clostridium sp.]|uniref:RNA polymerase sigma factor n=1 Tax=Clostridium sp. TaxID=1506 RepID=UPI003F30CA80